MKKAFKKLLPWLVTIAIFTALFINIPPQDVLATLNHAHMGLFIFYTFVLSILTWLADCTGLRWVFSRFGDSVSLKETFLMRGATYLLMLVNYSVSQGSMAFYLKKTHQVPLSQTFGAILFVSLIDLILMVVSVLVTSLFDDLNYRGISLRPLILQLSAVFFVFLIVWIVFWKRVGNQNWLAQREVLNVFKQAELKDYAILLAHRVPVVFIVIASFYFIFLPFESVVPLVDLFIYGPIVLLVGALPITPAGLGTTQALMVDFYKGSIASPLISQGIYGAEEILLACGVLWAFFNLVFKTIIGVCCVKVKSKDLFTPPQS